MTSDERVSAESAIDPAAGHTQHTEDLPRRKPWFRLVRKGSLAFWLLVSVAGLALTVSPTAFAFTVLLGPAVIGAGISGLLAEFTFSFDRREDDFDLQVQHQQYVNLEGRVGQVDGLVKKTKIVVVNQMFKLGVDLYQVRFLDEDQAEGFRTEAEDLADILKLTNPVGEFLSSPLLRLKEGLPGDGKDPFPDLKRAVTLRYPQDALHALMAGSDVGTIMHTAGGLSDKGYRETAVQILKDAIKLLYLLPEVYRNLARAIRELEEERYQPNYIAGYLTLFIFYLTYRMTGENPDVVPLFESRVSLTEPATIAAIKQNLAQLSGQSADASESASQPEISSTERTDSARGHHVKHKSLLRYTREEWKTLFSFVRKSSLAFWFAVSAVGLVLAVVPVNFAVKVLMSSAIVGAGIAGLLSEFTYSFDRRDSDSELKKRQRHYLGLKDHIGRVDELLRGADIVAINQMFMLGMDLSWVRFGQADQVESFEAEAKDIADFVGLSGPVGIFLQSPYLRLAENPPPPGGQDPMTGLMNAVGLRYAKEGLAAFRAGSTLGLVVNIGLPGGQFPSGAVSIFKAAIGLLSLPPEANDNMLRAMQELESGACKPHDFLSYLVLFSVYLKYRMTGESNYIVPLFEARASLAEPATAAQVQQLMKQLAAG
jgi:hypothetical protein